MIHRQSTLCPASICTSHYISRYNVYQRFRMVHHFNPCMPYQEVPFLNLSAVLLQVDLRIVTFKHHHLKRKHYIFFVFTSSSKETFGSNIDSQNQKLQVNFGITSPDVFAFDFGFFHLGPLVVLTKPWTLGCLVVGVGCGPAGPLVVAAAPWLFKQCVGFYHPFITKKPWVSTKSCCFITWE